MWILKYSKTCLEVSDEEAKIIIQQLTESGKDDFVILDEKVVFPIKKFESLEKLDEDIASDEEWKNAHAHPPMPTSEQDGKSTHNGVEIPDDLKRPKVPKA